MKMYDMDTEKYSSIKKIDSPLLFQKGIDEIPLKDILKKRSPWENNYHCIRSLYNIKNEEPKKKPQQKLISTGRTTGGVWNTKGKEQSAPITGYGGVMERDKRGAENGKLVPERSFSPFKTFSKDNTSYIAPLESIHIYIYIYIAGEGIVDGHINLNINKRPKTVGREERYTKYNRPYSSKPKIELIKHVKRIVSATKECANFNLEEEAGWNREGSNKELMEGSKYKLDNIEDMGRDNMKKRDKWLSLGEVNDILGTNNNNIPGTKCIPGTTGSKDIPSLPLPHAHSTTANVRYNTNYSNNLISPNSYNTESPAKGYAQTQIQHHYKSRPTTSKSQRSTTIQLQRKDLFENPNIQGILRDLYSSAGFGGFSSQNMSGQSNSHNSLDYKTRAIIYRQNKKLTEVAKKPIGLFMPLTNRSLKSFHGGDGAIIFPSGGAVDFGDGRINAFGVKPHTAPNRPNYTLNLML